jgi:hypothetical protein
LNGDAVITIDEFKTLFKIDETDLIDVQSSLELFHFMDTNGDGRITKQEFLQNIQSTEELIATYASKLDFIIDGIQDGFGATDKLKQLQSLKQDYFNQKQKYEAKKFTLKRMIQQKTDDESLKDPTNAFKSFHYQYLNSILTMNSTDLAVELGFFEFANQLIKKVIDLKREENVFEDFFNDYIVKKISTVDASVAFEFAQVAANKENVVSL